MILPRHDRAGPAFRRQEIVAIGPVRIPGSVIVGREVRDRRGRGLRPRRAGGVGRSGHQDERKQGRKGRTGRSANTKIAHRTPPQACLKIAEVTLHNCGPIPTLQRISLHRRAPNNSQQQSARLPGMLDLGARHEREDKRSELPIAPKLHPIAPLFAPYRTQLSAPIPARRLEKHRALSAQRWGEGGSMIFAHLPQPERFG